MILCSCNVLTKARILEAAARLSAERPDRPVAPGRVFRALGVKAQCALCFPQVRQAFLELGLMVTCPEPLASEAEETEILMDR